MIRHTVINAVVGGVMGYAGSILWQSGQGGLGILVYAAWLVGMINNIARPK